MRRSPLVLALVLVAGCGNDSKPSTPASQREPQTRGVATVRAELAQICVDRLRSGESGEASAAISSKVDQLIAAYEAGPKNATTRGVMENVRQTLENGCGTDRSRDVDSVIGP